MDITSTAQTAGNVALALGTLLNAPWTEVLKYLALGLVGLVLVPTFKQHLIEILVAKFNPSTFVKMLLPTALSVVSGAILKALGADSATALSAVGIWATLTHLVNESPLALTLAAKDPAVAEKLKAADEALSGAKITGLLLGFLLLGAAAHADATLAPTPIAGWCAGPSLWAGSSIYQTAPGGMVPSESALAGAQFAGYLGSWQGDVFTPSWTLGALVAFDTVGSQNFPAVGVQGGWYLLGAPVTGFVAWRLDKDAGGALLGLGTSVQFQGWVPFLYLGHPGN